MAIEMSFSKEEQKIESLIDFVYNIIDSKIQYLNYQTKGIIKPIDNSNSILGEANSDSFSLEEAEKLFLQFEVQSKQIKRLLYLRKLLNCKNSIVALSLLTYNILFVFEEHEIAYILDFQTKQKAA